MQRVLVCMVVLVLVACGRGGFERDAPGGCPLALNVDRVRFPEPMIDFPLLVRLDSAHVDRSRLQPGAGNLAFYLDGEELAYEIEDAGDPVLAWVRVPTLPESGARILVGYREETVTSTPVWSDAYTAVFHLARPPDDPGSDSTGNHTTKPIGAPPIAAVPGKIGGAREFDSTRGHAIEIPVPDLPYTEFTVSGWMYETMPPVGYHALVTRQFDTTDDNFFWIGGHEGRYVGEVYRSSGGLPLLSNKATMVGTWVHLALTASDRDTASRATLYINGEVDVAQSVDGVPTTGALRSIVLGADNNSNDPAPGIDLLDGSLDEVRIETIARSSAWVQADYLSMDDKLIRYEVLPTAAACQ